MSNAEVNFQTSVVATLTPSLTQTCQKDWAQ